MKTLIVRNEQGILIFATDSVRVIGEIMTSSNVEHSSGLYKDKDGKNTTKNYLKVVEPFSIKNFETTVYFWKGYRIFLEEGFTR